MDVMARLSSRGRLTVPKAVRDAHDLHEGDQIIFRVEGKRAAVVRTPRLLETASVPVPALKRDTPWSEVRRRTRADRVQARR